MGIKINKKVKIVQDNGHWYSPNLKKIEDCLGFIYKITYKESGKFYIGKKQIYSITNPKLSKKKSNELYKGTGRKPIRQKVVKETNWRIYTGSNKELNNDINLIGKDKFNFEILELCSTLAELKYKEVEHQIKNDCLVSTNCYNDWIKITITRKQLNNV